MSETQTKLVESTPEEMASESKTTKRSARSRTAKLDENGNPVPAKTKTTSATQMYAKMEVANEKLYNEMKSANQALSDNIGEASRRIVEVTNEVKQSNDKVVVTLIETEEKLDVLTQITEVLNQRLCELEIEHERAAPGPAEEPAPVQGGLVEVIGPASAAPVEVAPAETVPSEAEPAEEIRDNSSSRELFEKCTKEIARRDGELADKSYSNILEKICLLREDFGKLCGNMGKQIEAYSAKEVLSSFEAYLIDMENLLQSAGIVIGPYGNSGDQVNTQHQRIVGVVPTTDASKNGTVAERLSDGYEYKGRAVVKEKVNVYKLTESTPKQSETPEIEILG